MKRPTHDMETDRASLSKVIEEKITWAQRCYERYREGLLQDPDVLALLRQLKAATDASKRVMQASEISAVCTRCDKAEGGSCCGAGIEDKYDGWLLLINLLLQTELPTQRYDPKGCYFLGENGCLLKARHAICINYLCKKITEGVDPQKIVSLREKEGEELTTLFRLNERIKEAVRAGSEVSERQAWTLK